MRIRAPRQTACSRHVHLILGPSCPPLQLLHWEEKGGEGTGGADEGVPRSPAGVDPKETPLITKHLAGKLRTRHEQRLVTGRQVDRAWSAARMALACGWRERRIPTQVTLHPNPRKQRCPGSAYDPLGVWQGCRTQSTFSRD